MATFDEKQKGWEWTPEERRSRQAKLRHLRRTQDNVGAHVRWIAAHLPHYKDRSAAAQARLNEGLGRCPTIDLSNRARKYQPISPQEFDKAFASLLELLGPWRALFGDAEFDAARRDKNREIEARNKVTRARNAELRAKEEEVYRMIGEGDLFGALDKAGEHGLL